MSVVNGVVSCTRSFRASNNTPLIVVGVLGGVSGVGSGIMIGGMVIGGIVIGGILIVGIVIVDGIWSRASLIVALTNVVT
ncbi:hypothetical protein J7E71_10370 [Mesobacillus foraminis]|uniref:hypothetical protein n=1 Tax=Mesobacillus foraminis TaxID=279826 RepID=UPI001BEB5C17|nr:hypothetical protein [Mesobacillus foraminis]MBT2756357.1 hypothetical protein [Mesobacillus foraminis]